MNKRVLIVSLACVLLLAGCGTSKSEDKQTTQFGITIPTKDQNYLLFNDSGKQLGGTFKEASSFSSGASVVENDKGEEGIINTSGKMIVPFNKYKRISPLAYMFKATTKDDEEVLLDNNGKVVASLEDTSINSYGLLAIQFKDKVVAYDLSGKELISVDSKEDTEFTSELAHGVDTVYGFLSVGNKTYLFDMITNKTLDTFESDVFYENITLINHWLILSGDDTYKVYHDLKPVGIIDSECDEVTIQIEALQCRVGRDEYVLDEQLMKSLLISGQGIQYQNSQNYVKSPSIVKDTNFVENGQEVKTISNMTFGASGYHRPFGLYPMSDGKNHTTLYNNKGELVTETVYNFIDDFNEFGHAIARINQTNFIIDTTGTKISDDFSDVSFIRWGKFTLFYVGENESGTVVYDPAMKELYRGDIISAAIDYKINNIAIINGYDANKNAVVYNATIGKEVYRGEGKVFVDRTHFTVTNKDKTTYYTFNGDKLLEE